MKNPRRNKLSWLSLLLITVMTLQCQTDPSLLDPSPFSADPISENTFREDLARQLARVIADEGVREFLKDEAVKRFDGDFDILFAEAARKTVISKVTGGSMTFAELLFRKNLKSTEDVSSYIEAAERNFPLLQISIPALSQNVNAITWDIKKTTPVIAYDPVEAKDDMLPAFDYNGKRVELSRRIAPNHLVVTVGENERLVAFAKSDAGLKNAAARTQRLACPSLALEADPYFSTQSTDYYFTADYYDLCEAPPPPPDEWPEQTVACDRDRFSGKDYFGRFKFNGISNLRDAESWIDGKPEIRCVVAVGGTVPTAFTTLSKYFSDSRHEFKDCDWLGLNCWAEWVNFYPTEVITWDPSLYGNIMKYSWYEEDSGDPVEVSTQLTTNFKDDQGGSTAVTSSVKYTIKNGDWPIGESYVEYCDNIEDGGYQYSTGRAFFYVRKY